MMDRHASVPYDDCDPDDLPPGINAPARREQPANWNVEFDCPQEQVDAMFGYLEDLRQSGVTNMFGAGPYVAEEFDIDKATARKVVAAWMKTGEEKRAEA
jgi:hypothetical protein